MAILPGKRLFSYQGSSHDHWDDILQLATSIRSGTLTASAMLQKLSAYPCQNGLAVALREIGRISR
jgi:TnpA family transposase